VAGELLGKGGVGAVECVIRYCLCGALLSSVRRWGGDDSQGLEGRKWGRGCEGCEVIV
jgi:hypothetical protein